MKKTDHELTIGEAREMAKRARIDFNLDEALCGTLFEVFKDDIEEELWKQVRSKFESEIKPIDQDELQNPNTHVEHCDFVAGLRAFYENKEASALKWALYGYHPITFVINTGTGETQYYKDELLTNGVIAWTTPLSLLQAYQGGDFETDDLKLGLVGGGLLCYDTDKISADEDMKNIKFVPIPFYEWLVSLGSKIFEKLRSTGIIDDLTYRIVKKKMTRIEEGKRAEAAKIEVVKIPKRDRALLKSIDKVKDALSLSQWGELLKKTKTGVLYIFRRLEKEGRLKVEKSAKGFRVSLTDKGRRAIAMPD